MDPAVFKVVCVPLLGIRHTALLAISTPDSEYNFFSELFQLRNEEGEPFFHLISIGLACEACLEAGLVCMHKLDKLPHWKTTERQALIDAILATDAQLADTETRGVIKSSKREIFEKGWLAQLAARPLFEWENDPHVLWMGIDPAGKARDWGGRRDRARADVARFFVFAFVCVCVFVCACARAAQAAATSATSPWARWATRTADTW